MLAGRRLRPEMTLDDSAVFADPAWSLFPAMLRADSRRLTLHFDRVPGQFRQVTKELFFVLLTGDLPPGEVLLSIGSIRKLFTELVRFLTWAGGTHPAAGEPV